MNECEYKNNTNKKTGTKSKQTYEEADEDTINNR